MDNYKFGNTLCKLREEHNLTQREFAQILDVSDKAVSKWENGQAIPRMDKLEKIAEVLETSVEELIILGREGTTAVKLKNRCTGIAHLIIDNNIISLFQDEEKIVEISNAITSHKVVAYCEFNLDNLEPEENEVNGLKEKLAQKALTGLLKYTSKVMQNNCIQAKCTYEISNISAEDSLTLELEMFSIGDKMWLGDEIDIAYLKITSDSAKITLQNAECMNKIEVLKSFKKIALTSELGISIPFMLLAYPFRKMYFKNLLKPKGLMKHLNKADYYVAKFEKEEKKLSKVKHPFLKTIGIIILFIIAFFAINIFFDIQNVDIDKPILISSDYNTITYYREEYVRIDDLPKDAIPNKQYGIEFWTDARTDGQSKTDQFLEDTKATEFVDRQGNIYIWVMFNYSDNFIKEDGEYAEYDDFTEHYVYALKNSEN